MISKRAKFLFALRTSFTRILGNAFPLRWNWSTERLQVNKAYGRWNFNIFLSYLFWYLFFLVVGQIRRFSAVQIFPTELVEEGSSFSDGATIDDEDNPLVYAIDILFTIAIWCIGSVMTLIVQKCDSFVCLANLVLDTDAKLEGNLNIFIIKNTFL